MPRVELHDLDIERCIDFCLEKRENGKMKYFTVLEMNCEDVDKYSCWLNECDSMGFDFCLAFVKTNGDNGTKYCVCGFSNFELLRQNKSQVLNFSFLEVANDLISEHYFRHWAERADFFLISGFDYIQRKIFERITHETLNVSVYETMERLNIIKTTRPIFHEGPVDFKNLDASAVYDDEDSE